MIVKIQDKKFKTNFISRTIDTSVPPKMVTGLRLRFIQLRIRITFIKVIIACYRNPVEWISCIRYLIQLRRRFLGNNKVHKMVYVNGKYHIGLYTPGWNSNIYEHYIAAHLNDYKPIKYFKVNRFNNVFMAITKKCALQCEHCFEWENLNKKDILGTAEWRAIVKKIQERGVSQIHFSGGEPLLKMDTLVQLLNSADKSSEFWLVTSGFKLTHNNAHRLKQAGLTGAVISLDHHDPALHNQFRHFDEAYYWVEEAVKNANNNEIITALSLCPIKSFISEENLMSYMELAKKLKVSFVQFLEPKAVGHYANRDVKLHQEHIEILERFFRKMNFSKDFSSYPIIIYHGYYQRRQGCMSAGKKGIYIDTDGAMNACPFCHKKTGSILDSNFDQNVEILKSEGCPTYK